MPVERFASAPFAPIHRARFLREHGEIDAALAALGEARDPAASLLRATCALDQDDGDGARRHLHHARADGVLGAGAGDEVRREAALVALRLALAAGAADEAREHLEYLSVIEPRNGRATEIATEALIWASASALEHGSIALANAQLERAAAVLAQSIRPSATLGAQLRCIRARLAFQDPARLRESHDLARRAYEEACEVHAPFVASGAAMVMAEIAISRKDDRGALCATELALMAGTTTADPSRRFAHLLRAQILPFVGRSDQAAVEVAQAREALPESHPHHLAIALTEMTNLAQARRHAELAAKVIVDEPRFAARSGHPLYALYLMFRGEARAALGSQNQAKNDLVDAVDLLEARRNVCYLAAVYPTAFKVTRNRRFHNAARTLFGDTRRSRDGGQPMTQPAPPAGGRLGLTQRQREVAMLAAEGQSNKAIAARLRIAPKTVTHHLEAVFDRLDVRSRWQLRGALVTERGGGLSSIRDASPH